jgi:hypothetical protein
MPTEKKLLDQVRDTLRLKHYAIRTEEAYVDWIRRFILFHDKRHPREMSTPEIRVFLTHLAVERDVAASAQTQAFSALLFLYREVLQQELDPLDLEAIRARKPRRLPTVLTKSEVQAVLRQMSGTQRLVTQLLYGVIMAAFTCSMLWSANVPTHAMSEVGSTSFRPAVSDAIRAVLLCAAIIYTKALSRKPSAPPRKPLGFSNPSTRTPFAIPAPRTCSKPNTTSARSRNCWDTKT